MIGSTPADSSRIDTEVVVPRYLSNFWRSRDLPSWFTWRNCIISEISRKDAVVGANPAPGTTIVKHFKYIMQNFMSHLSVGL